MATQAKTTGPFGRRLGHAVERAHKLALAYTESVPRNIRKDLGQFFTPPDIARFMAQLVPRLPSQSLTILDPGAGTGVLCAAVCERLAVDPHCVRLHVDAYETSNRLLPLLRETLKLCRLELHERGKEFTFSVHGEDFVRAYAHRLNGHLLREEGHEAWREYDIVVSNPPYGKLRKDDPRSVLASRVVHGQPNIYALFMAISAHVLTPEGALVFIVPRSFASGAYFGSFRAEFFSRMEPWRIHVFESRRAAFEDQGVLQENMILAAGRHGSKKPGGRASQVLVSSSHGIEDLHESTPRRLPLSRIIDTASLGAPLCIPISTEEDEVIDVVRRWPMNLASLALQVSTGPVVAFRTRTFHRERPGPRTVPFLWMQHIRPMATQWPLNGLHKPQYFEANQESRKLLLPATNMVVFRRFSAKEQARRITAAPLHAGDSGWDRFALENHLNYITRPGSDLLAEEAVGIAAVLNLSIVDRYFRAFNGNTQVGASEIRVIPFPGLERIRAVGRALGRWADAYRAEQVAADILDIPQHLRTTVQA